MTKQAEEVEALRRREAKEQSKRAEEEAARSKVVEAAITI